MDFQILMTKFRTLEATILGLVNTNKTYDELLKEVETLETQIRKEAMRDGGLPNFLIQKTYDDIDNVKTFLKETKKVEHEQKVEVKKEEKVAETETKKEEVLVEKTEATKQEETPKKKGKTAKAE
jgi:outer membrane biosynthesis protein TonB